MLELIMIMELYVRGEKRIGCGNVLDVAKVDLFIDGISGSPHEYKTCHFIQNPIPMRLETVSGINLDIISFILLTF